MICLGNICRSPIAQGVMQHLSDQQGLNWTVESAGTNRYHTGEAPHISSQKVCAEHGIDISSQRARTFTSDDMKRYDILFVLAEDVMKDVQRMAGHLFDPSKVIYLTEYLHPGEKKSIKDPWYGGEEGYYPVYDEIDLCCRKFIQQVTSIH